MKLAFYKERAQERDFLLWQVRDLGVESLALRTRRHFHIMCAVRAICCLLREDNIRSCVGDRGLACVINPALDDAGSFCKVWPFARFAVPFPSFLLQSVTRHAVSNDFCRQTVYA